MLVLWTKAIFVRLTSPMKSNEQMTYSITLAVLRRKIAQPTHGHLALIGW
jgi:hypothetical protein